MATTSDDGSLGSPSDFVPSEAIPSELAAASANFADFEARLAEHLQFDEGKRRMLESLGLLEGGGLRGGGGSAMRRPREKRQRVWEKRELPQRSRRSAERLSMSILGGIPGRRTDSPSGMREADGTTKSALPAEQPIFIVENPFKPPCPECGEEGQPVKGETRIYACQHCGNEVCPPLPRPPPPAILSHTLTLALTLSLSAVARASLRYLRSAQEGSHLPRHHQAACAAASSAQACASEPAGESLSIP